MCIKASRDNNTCSSSYHNIRSFFDKNKQLLNSRPKETSKKNKDSLFTIKVSYQIFLFPKHFRTIVFGKNPVMTIFFLDILKLF